MPEDYSFLQEKIKDEKPSRKKIILSMTRIVCAGLLFGIATAISFCAIKPWVETTFLGKTKKIEIPKDEEVEEPVVTEEETPQKTVLDIDSYRELSQVLQDISSEAQKSVVDISGTSGVIVANNGQELLILSNNTVLKNEKSLKVTFFDNESYTGTMKQRAGNLDLIMLGVEKSKLKETTLERVKVAELGNSNRVCQGDTLIAIGSPFGYGDSIGYGIASSVSNRVTRADGIYNIITTDMVGTDTSDGVLFDIDGKVVGIIVSDITGTGKNSPLVAYGISNIKTEIELMSNGKGVPYVGIIGTMVTTSIAEAQNIPEGLYVTEIEKDSPAMKAGIRAGDVLTAMDGEAITSLSVYHELLMGKEVEEKIKLKGQRIGTETYVEIDFEVTVGTKK